MRCDVPSCRRCLLLLFLLSVEAVLAFPRQLSRPLQNFRLFFNSELLNEPKKKVSKPKEPIKVCDLSELRRLIKEGYRVRDLDVRGNTTSWVDKTSPAHPVIIALHKRLLEKSRPGQRAESDTAHIGLAIEGGGMRACVATGMTTAVAYLGLDDSVDVVYGSSAGSLIGAYFITKQMQSASDLYYDVLTTAGKEFIDTQAILRSVGLGIFDLRLQSFVDMFTDRLGKPVLNLDYLLEQLVCRIRPLDWKTFWKKQEDQSQVLKVVASGLISRKSIAFSASDGNFKSLPELLRCMRTSMLLPGLTGELMRLKGAQLGKNLASMYWREFRSRRDSALIIGSEPMCDAVVFEPVPYRSALRDNCTHILAFRTRADNMTVIGKMGTLETMMIDRFFKRKNSLPDVAQWMSNQYHKLVYAEDMLILNDASNSKKLVRDSDVGYPTNGAYIYTVALPPNIPEVGRLETSREVIFENMRMGFAVAYDSLVADPSLQGQGAKVAREIWPNDLMLAPPKFLAEIAAATVVLSSESSSEIGALGSLNAVAEGLAAVPSVPVLPEKKALAALKATSAAQLPLSKREQIVRFLRSVQAVVMRSAAEAEKTETNQNAI